MIACSALLAALSSGCDRSPPPSLLGKEVLSITFARKEPGSPETVVRVTDPDEVASLVGSIALVPKPACRCRHIERIVFHAATEEMHASVCNHCLNLPDHRCRMPPALYSALREHLGLAAPTFSE